MISVAGDGHSARMILRVLPFCMILIGAAGNGGAQTVTLEMRISVGSDDAEERASGSMKFRSGDLELTFDRGGNQTVGLRFTGLDIPPSATISNAYIQFKVDKVNTEVTSLVIQGELSGNSSPFVDQAGNITARPRTVAAVPWAPPPWTTGGEIGVDQQTPDLGPIIQEIVNLPGWAAGNALVVVISGTGERTAKSFEGDPIGAPSLHVEYQTGPINEFPTVTATAPATGSSHTVNRAITFSGTATDTEDGDLTTGLAWTSDRDGAIGAGGSISTSVLSLGDHTITASATDSGGRTNSDQIDITVVADALPVVNIAAPAPISRHTVNRPVTFNGTATDPEDGDLTTGLAWTSDRDGAIGTGGSISTSVLSLGDHTITASATDLAGGVGTATVTVTVNPDAPPVVSIAAPATASEHIETDAIVFTGTASDSEDGDLTASLTWTSSVDGAIGSDGSFSTGGLSLGTHIITASAIDLAGGTGTAEIMIVVKANTAPQLTITEPLTGSSVTHGQMATFGADATDAEDGDISAVVAWSSNIDGPIGTGGGITTNALSEGKHSITASVADRHGLADSAQISFSVDENTAPAVTILAPVDQSRYVAGQSVDFSGTSGDDKYLLESHASVSPFGDKIVFRSNWDMVDGAIDAYVITLGATPITGTDPYPTPTIPRPVYLQPITDPVFGQTVVRVTDAGQPINNPTGDPSLVGQSWGQESGHGYSTRVAWNADQSLLMLEKGVAGDVFLDGTTFEPLMRRNPPGSVRWHPTDPNVMLFIEQADRCLGAYEPVTDTIRFRRCFTGYDSFSWSDPGKGKPSNDGNIIPVRARRTSDNHWVAFLYNISSDTASGEIDMTTIVEPGDVPDFTMSPLGDVIIVNGCIVGHSGNCQAQVAIDVATKAELWRVLTEHDPGHADEIIDAQGQQWRVGRSKEGVFANQVIKRNFRTGAAVSLIPYSGSHVSTRGIHGPREMAIVSFHAPNGPLRSEIDAVCIDGSCLERYAHTHRVADEENAELTANLSWESDLDGTIGNGGSFSTASLSQGAHTITASVTDSGGFTGSDKIGLIIASAGTTIAEVRISAGSDDAEERAPGGMKLASSDLEMSFDGGGDQTVGLRFTGVMVPAGASITDAYVQFQVDEVNTVATSLTIQGEAAVNPATFIDVKRNISSRPRTAATVSWTPAGWSSVGQTGTDQRTPNLAPIIQEIVDTPDWSSGNAIVIIIAGTGERTAESFDGKQTAAPLLHITFD